MAISNLNVICVSIAISISACFAVSNEDEPFDANDIGQVDNTKTILPDWIKTEGIRAGFMSSTSGDLEKIPRYVKIAKDIGLNTAIVYGCSFAETPNHLKYYRQWFRLCNKANLHIFAFYPWQPPAGNKCRPVVFSDGTQGLFPCPLDDDLWQNYLMADMAGKLAKLSTGEQQTAFDGFFLDTEMYRTEKQPHNKRNYSFDTCFCDHCFSSFLLTKGYDGPSLPRVEKGDRKQWLTKQKFLSDYYAYLQKQVEIRAQQLKVAIRTVNPSLLFGIYPALNDTNWVRVTVARVFGRDSYPVVSFTTDTFGYYSKPWGAARIPTNMSRYFNHYDINGIYVAGYLLRAYTSSEIGKHLVESRRRSHGYWLFRMPQLLEREIPKAEHLAEGTRTDYQREIKNANENINEHKSSGADITE